MTKTPPTTLREWLSEGGTEQQWYHLQRTERGLDRPAPPPWKPVLMLHEREQPTFPVDVLPKPLRDFALGMACEQQTPVDLAATSALAVFSATLAQKIRVETRTSQPLPVNLFVANITQGTLGEECVIGEVRSPLERLELGNFDVWREPIAKRQSLRRQDKIRLRRLELLGVDSTRSRDEAIEFAAKLEMNPVPAMPQMIVDDTTRGRLEKILSQQNGRLAAFYGEGAILDLFTGTQSRSRIAQRELFRRCHRGEKFLVQQRGDQRTLVKDASITCQMAVPQWSIEGLHRHRSRRGRGVLDCFLFSMPKKNVAPRDLKQRATIPIEALQDYHDLIADGWRNKTVYTLKLSSEARDVFQLFENEVEGHLTRHPEEALFRAWLDRLPEQTLRIAGVLHSTALRSPNLEESPKLEEQIPVETMRAAVTIARYFIPHTEAAFAAMHCHWDDATDGARYLLDWFMSENVKTFTRREAHQRSRARFRQAWEIDAPLAELVRRGYIRPLPDDPTDKKRAGQPGSPRYEVQTEIYYIHRHPAYSFGEIGAPVTLAELASETSSEHKPPVPRAHEEQTPNPGAMPSSSSACEAKSKPEVNSEHDRRQSAQQDQGTTPTPKHSEHDRREPKRQPPGGDIAAPFKKRSEDKRRQRNKKRLCDAPSVKEFKKKNPHLLKMYLEQIKPLLDEHGMSDDRRPS